MLKLIRNTLSNTGAKLLTLVLSILATPVLLESVGDEGYALLMLIPTITGYFNLMGGGVPGGTVKFIAEYEAKGDWAMISRVINSSLLFFILIGALVASSLVAFVAFGGLQAFNVSEAKAPVAATLLLIAAGLSLFSWPINAISSTLEGLQEHHARNIAVAATTLMSLVAAILAAKLGASLVTIFVAQNAAYVVRWIWLTVALKRRAPHWRPNPLKGSWETFKTIFGLSAWMLALQVASMLTYKFDELVIGASLPVAMLTVYHILTRPFQLVREASSMFNSAVVPAVSAYEASAGRAGLDVFIYTGARYNNVLVAPLAVTSTYLCAPFIAVWVGESYLQWVWIAQLACLFQLLWQSNSTLGRVFYGTGKVERVAGIALVSAVANAVLSILLVNALGVAGVLLATVIVGCLAVPAQYLLVFPSLDIPRLNYFKRTVLAAQWPHWIAALALLPLWGWMQTIRSPWVLALVALTMTFGLGALSWFIGVEREHRRWAYGAIAKRLYGSSRSAHVEEER